MSILSIIIVNYNAEDDLINLLISLKNSEIKINFEIIVVNNGEYSPNINEYCQELDLKLIENENKGFGGGNNIGVAQAKGDYLLFLNCDTIVSKGFVDNIYDFTRKSKKVAFVGPAVFYPDGSFQDSYGKEPNIMGEILSKYISKFVHKLRYKITRKNKVVDWLSGVAFCCSKEIFNELEGFDENYFIYYEDCDICKRAILKGYDNIYMPSVSLIHIKGNSCSKRPLFSIIESKKSQLLYYKKFANNFSMAMLKEYLLIKFYLKLFLTKKNKIKEREAFQKLIKIIKEY